MAWRGGGTASDAIHTRLDPPPRRRAEADICSLLTCDGECMIASEREREKRRRGRQPANHRNQHGYPHGPLGLRVPGPLGLRGKYK